MTWILGVGVGAAVLWAVRAWMNRERNPPNYGTISDQWRSEQRLKERESSDR